MIDPIADMLTRIRNASKINKQEVLIPFSNIKNEIGKILVHEGFVKKLEKIEHVEKKSVKLPYLLLHLKYKNSESVVQGIRRVSTPGRRVYQGYHNLPKVLPSLGILIISTPRGLMTNREARKQKLGGEVLCEVY